MEQEKIVSLNADKSLRRALDIKEAKDLLKREGLEIMSKKELIKKIEWIIEGLEVGDNIFKVVQDIDKLIKEEKNQNN